MKRKYLMTPGPSPVPTFVREALAKEILHHRTDEFRQILKEAGEGLQKVFCTKNPVVTLTSSGTGAMEAVVTNLFSPGDKVVAVCGGKFGQRWSELGTVFGLDVIEMNIEWGTSPDSTVLKTLLTENKGVKAVLTTLCETSTATVYDIKALGEVTSAQGCLLVVDAISGLGQDTFLPDEWGVDVVVSGTQKGFMLPPGLAFISLSAKAQSVLVKSTLPRYYFDLQKALKNYTKDDTPYTPGVSLIVALRESLAYMQQEGIQNRWKRFDAMGKAAREAALALGLEVFSKRPSSSVTALSVPPNIKSSQIVKSMRKDYGVSIAGGQDHMKDKIIRIAHMGWINEQDLMMCFSLLEKVLIDQGCTFTVGASLARLQEVLYG